MQENSKKLFFLVLLVPLLAIIIAFNPLSSGNSLASSTWTGTTTYWANVRTGPSTSYGIAAVDAPGTTLLCMPLSQARLSGEAYPTGIASAV